MELTGIIIVVALFVIGILIGWIIWGRKASSDNTAINEAESKSEILEATLAEKTKSLLQAQEEAKTLGKKVKDIKDQYAVLQEENKKRLEDLESQLQNVTEGKIDVVVKNKLAQLDELRKKVKSLEDDVDDLEDDVDNYKKKLKNKTSELTITQENLEKANRDVKRLQDDLSETKESLSDKSKELERKIQSLDFVQEILLAKVADSEDDRKLGENVDILKDFIRGEFEDSFKGIINLDKSNMKDLFGHSLDSWAATARKSWLSGKTTIAFVGEFSAGKTSIVNRILSQDDPKVPLLPVSTKATTAIPTYISGAPKSSYRFVTPNDEIKALSETTFKKVNKEILDQVKGISSLVKYFVMRYENPNLENLSILDTPGFNSNDKEDADRTIDVINECDALFWVFDVNAGTVNRSSIELIKNNLHRPLYVVINKVDTKSTVEVDQVQSLISKTLEDEGVHVEAFIRFSAKAPLDTIMTPIKGIRHDFEKDAYLETLQKEAIQVYIGKMTRVRDLEKRAKKTQSKSQYFMNKFSNSLSELESDCRRAAEIPHWEEHMFRKDRFEMSAEEGEELGNILEKIQLDHPRIVRDIYENQMKTVKALVSSWQEASEVKSHLISLQNGLKGLKARIKAVSPNSIQEELNKYI